MKPTPFVTIYRRDMIANAEINAFDDLLDSLGVPESGLDGKPRSDIESIELEIASVQFQDDSDSAIIGRISI